MKQIYKNLYYDDEIRGYVFADENDIRPIVEQQSYLLIYLIEILLNKSGEQKVWQLPVQ